MIQVKFNVKKFQQAVNAQIRMVNRAIKTALQQWAGGTLFHFITHRLAGRPGLVSRTGALRRSFKFKVKGRRIGDMEASIYSTSPYAITHEEGKRIVKKTKLLAIPLPSGPAMGPNMNPLYASPLRASLPPAAGFHVIQSKTGNLLLRDKYKIRWFLLRDEVYVPERMFFIETVKERLEELTSNMRDEIKEATRG